MKRIVTTISIYFLFIASVNLNAQDNDKWEILNEGNPYRYNTIDFINENIGWLITGEGMLKTEDGGESWQKRNPTEPASVS